MILVRLPTVWQRVHRSIECGFGVKSRVRVFAHGEGQGAGCPISTAASRELQPWGRLIPTDGLIMGPERATK